MSPDEARRIIAEGEGQHTEFKESVGQLRPTIETLGAFANSEGGKVFLGVGDEGKILGLNRGRQTLEHFAQNLRQNTDPPLDATVDEVQMEEGSLVVVEVSKAPPHELVQAYGRFFVRIGPANHRMSTAEIRSRLGPASEREEFERRACRIRDGIEKRIKLVRNGACWPVAHLTTNLFDVPPHSSQDRGPYYVRENYRELWGVLVNLSVPLGVPFPLPPMVDHSIRMWEWIMRSFVEVSKDCSRSIQDYGSGLVEYPEVLEAMGRVRNAVEGERTAWRLHHADVARKIEYRDTLPIHQRPDYPDSDIPDEAIRNLRTIALTTMTLIATIARTLEDWPDIPSEEDSHYEPTFFYAANGWRTEDPL